MPPCSRNESASSIPSGLIQPALVLANREVCREHLRLVLRVEAFPESRPGQFVHLGPVRQAAQDYQTLERSPRVREQLATWQERCSTPLLRRAFSIAALNRARDHVRLEIVYRVVGKATGWLASLSPGDALSVLGPLGSHFPIVQDKSRAWMVAGGVGVPPMLWLSESLKAEGKRAVAFCGARSKDLLPLTIDPQALSSSQAGEAVMTCAEFARNGVPVVLSTDDGSMGFAGYVGDALASYHQANPVDPGDVVVYACGPERMLESVADYCTQQGMECYVCLERTMACGMGACQSCVVPLRDGDAPEGWRYHLCCVDGPVFEAGRINWKLNDRA